jgi:hypothetical protein
MATREAQFMRLELCDWRARSRVQRFSGQSHRLLALCEIALLTKSPHAHDLWCLHACCCRQPDTHRHTRMPG